PSEPLRVRCPNWRPDGWRPPHSSRPGDAGSRPCPGGWGGDRAGSGCSSCSRPVDAPGAATGQLDEAGIVHAADPGVDAVSTKSAGLQVFGEYIYLDGSRQTGGIQHAVDTIFDQQQTVSRRGHGQAGAQGIGVQAGLVDDVQGGCAHRLNTASEWLMRVAISAALASLTGMTRSCADIPRARKASASTWMLSTS